MNCNGEILFLKINDLWIMNVSKNDYSYYSAELMPILNDGVSVKFNVHSHPNNDKNINVGVPSINDLRYGNSSNKLAYIIHDKGVLEYDLSSVENIDKDELYIIWSKLRSSNEKFKDMNEFEFQNLFCDAIGLKRRNMSFEELIDYCNRNNILLDDDMLKSLKVLHGPIGAKIAQQEFKIDDEGNIKIIEIGARMGGDCIGSDLVKISTGYNYLKMVIDVAMGNKPNFEIESTPKISAIWFGITFHLSPNIEIPSTFLVLILLTTLPAASLTIFIPVFSSN